MEGAGRRPKVLALCLAFVYVAVLCQSAAGRSLLPTTTPDGNPLTYLALDHERAIAYQGARGSWSIFAAAFDGSPARQIASAPAPADPQCASAEPEDFIGDSAIAAGERHLVSWGFASCKLGDGNDNSVDVVGPFSGPFKDAGLGSCGFGQMAVSSKYVTCTDADARRIEVAPLATGGHRRTIRVPGSLKSTKLAGVFLVTASFTRAGGTTFTVTNLRTGRRALSLRLSSVAAYALGSDGKLVVATGLRRGHPCASVRRVAWYSPKAPRAHRIGYAMCTRKMVLRGGKLTFQAPAANGLIAIDRGDLRGSRVKLLTRYTPAGSLIDADDAHVLAADRNCAGKNVIFVSPGRSEPDPSTSCG